MQHHPIRYLFGLIFIFLFGSPLFAQLLFYGESVIVMEAESGRVLYSYRPDAPHIPASLTKVVALSVVYDAIARGDFSYSTPITISPEATWSAQPPGSSLMLLEPGQNLTLRDLMLGMAIPSGNDAGVAIAETISGSVPTFVAKMNQLMQDLGLSESYFVDAAGIMSGNITTAREYATFIRHYLYHYPQALADLHAVPSFSFPTLQQMNHQGTIRFTRQHNNGIGLLNNYEGADGLKTGFLTTSGYNLVTTAIRDGMRLIAVIFGVRAPGRTTGSLRRESDARALFDHGFTYYRFYNLQDHPELSTMQRIRVWGMRERYLIVEPNRLASRIRYPLRESEWQQSHLSLHMDQWHPSELRVGDRVGYLRLTLESEEQFDVELLAREPLKRLPFWLYLNERIQQWIAIA